MKKKSAATKGLNKSRPEVSNGLPPAPKARSAKPKKEDGAGEDGGRTSKKSAGAEQSGGPRLFVLHNVDANSLDQRYSLNSVDDDFIPENVTKLSDLSVKHETISFLDDAKKTRTASLLMADINNMNLSGHYLCFWDRHPIGKIRPIGCPVEFVFSRGVRDYVSEISKNRYVIRESVTKCCYKNIYNEAVVKQNKCFGAVEQDFYLTDGAFCSFNCCLAYIKANKHNPLYKNSEQLLYKLYRDFFGRDVDKITPANCWRTLLVHGGKLTIAKFRENLESVEYNYQGPIKLRPIAHVYEEKYKL